jgi:hypothetical protein
MSFMRFKPFVLLIFALYCWATTAQAALFKFQLAQVSVDEVQVTLVVDDLTKLRAFYNLQPLSDLMFIELSATVGFSAAWVSASIIPGSFVVPRITDFQNVTAFDDAGIKSLILEATVRATDLRNLNINDPVFSFKVKRPATQNGTLTLNYAFLGSGDAPVVADIAARLAELGVNDSNGTLAQIDISPVSATTSAVQVPIPWLAQVFMLLGLFSIFKWLERRQTA